MDKLQQEQFANFVTNLNKFIKDLNRYLPNDGCKDFLESFQKLDMGKVLLRFMSKMKGQETKLANKDESMFQPSFIIFPGIDLGILWLQLHGGQKNKLWTYLQVLHIQGELLLKTKEQQPSSTSVPVPTTTTSVVPSTEGATVPSIDFNPYVGVGGNPTNSTSYSVDEMFSGVDKDDSKTEAPGLGSISSLFGVNKLLNLDKLSEELKNMKPEDIDEATNNIKGLLGNNIDGKTGDLIGSMLLSINEELKKDPKSTSNPLDSIFKIAETVADKMKPKIQSEGINMQDLWGSAENIATQCKDSKGNPIFGNGQNPFNMIKGMMSGQMNEEEYIKGYQEMLKSTGIDPNKLNLADLQQKMMKAQQNKGQNKGQKKHKKKKQKK